MMESAPTELHCNIPKERHSINNSISASLQSRASTRSSDVRKFPVSEKSTSKDRKCTCDKPKSAPALKESASARNTVSVYGGNQRRKAGRLLEGNGRFRIRRVRSAGLALARRSRSLRHITNSKLRRRDNPARARPHWLVRSFQRASASARAERWNSAPSRRRGQH